MWLFIGDLHLTDNSRDEYRWGIFNWIKKQQDEYKPAATFLAGDITDSKDRHSATLVNRIVSGLTLLKPPVYIAMGNHDYRDPKNPFFKFLNHIDGIKFITKPEVVHGVGVLPHVRTQNEFDAMARNCAGLKPTGFLCHQTFEGAIAESGVRLSGLSASLIESVNAPMGVYAGDVHRPQTQGQVTYIGCPYNVRFGDNFEPRCIHVDQKGIESYPWFDAPRKWSLTVRGPENLFSNKELVGGDQVKLTIELPREEAVEWKQVKADVLEACKELMLEVHGTKIEVKTTKRRERIKVQEGAGTLQVFEQFCKAENVAANIAKKGKSILNGHN